MRWLGNVAGIRATRNTRTY